MKNGLLAAYGGSTVQPQTRRVPHQGVVSLRDGIECPPGLRMDVRRFGGMAHWDRPKALSRESLESPHRPPLGTCQCILQEISLLLWEDRMRNLTSTSSAGPNGHRKSLDPYRGLNATAVA
jgi:hypothetical protein